MLSHPIHCTTLGNAKEHMQNRRQEAGLILGHDKDSNGDRYANRSGARRRHQTSVKHRQNNNLLWPSDHVLWEPLWVCRWDSSQHALQNKVLIMCLFIQHSFWNNVIMLFLLCWVWVHNKTQYFDILCIYVGGKLWRSVTRYNYSARNALYCYS